MTRRKPDTDGTVTLVTADAKNPTFVTLQDQRVHKTEADPPRLATHEDVEDIIALLVRIEKKDRASTGNDYIGIPYAENHLRSTLHEMINRPNAAVFWSEHGAYMVEVMPYPANFASRQGMEILFRTDGTGGPALLRAGRAWLYDQGAVTQHVSTIIGLSADPDKQERVLKRLGYDKVSTLWVKKLV